MLHGLIGTFVGEWVHADGKGLVVCIGQEVEACLLGKFVEGNMFLGGFALGLEHGDLLIQLRDAFLEFGLTPLEGFYLMGFKVTFEVCGTEFCDFASPDPELLTHLSIEGTVGEVHDWGGLRK